jgi:hypothetical protein
MINNINYTIKIDLEQSCELLLEYNADMFEVTLVKNHDGTYTIPEWNVTGDKLTIMHWFYIKNKEWEKQEEDDLIEHLKNDDLEYVIERLK